MATERKGERGELEKRKKKNRNMKTDKKGLKYVDMNMNTLL